MNHNGHQQNSSILDSYESSENALMDSFKAAALKVTTLYKDSLVQNRKAYASGYQQALQDLYEFISSHPNTTVSQHEHGLLPVEDLLAYARQRNTQLTSDMGFSASMDSPSPAHHSVSPQPQHSHSTSSSDALSSQSTTTQSFDTDLRSQQQQQSQQGFIDHTTSSNIEGRGGGMTAAAAATTAISSPSSQSTTSVPGVIGAAVKNAFHPFQIDPNTQFTFTLPSNYHPHGQPWYNHSNGNTNHHGTNNNYGSTNFMGTNGNGMDYTDNGNTYTTISAATAVDGTPMEGLKRRIAPNELSFMGRSLNSMNIDSNWNEPAMKRRMKRDD